MPSLGNSHWSWWVAAGLATMAIRAALLPWLPIPLPSVPDEFSYLLGAETFALGRMTNPPHAHWPHFEAMHVNPLPTYASKYPPAQALFLAAGIKWAGHPWFGVWLSCGLMVTSLGWMLAGWLPARFALLATLFAICQFSVTTAWMNSYWGGAVPALGGALLLGALPRMARRASAGAAALGAAGAMTLANSRPYEGAFLGLATLAALVWWRRKEGRGLGGLAVPQVLGSFLLVVVPTIAAMAWYNFRVTGDPRLPPYTVNQKMYSATPFFAFLPDHPDPVYRHEDLRKLWAEWDKGYYDRARQEPWVPLIRFGYVVATFYLGWLGLPLAAVAIWKRSGRRLRVALAISGAAALWSLLPKSTMPHYLAHLTGLVCLVVAAGFRFLRPGHRLTACFVIAAGLVFARGFREAVRDAAKPGPGSVRRSLAGRLTSGGGKHLIIVRYAPSHDLHEDYVANAADLDGSPVVLARDMGGEKNRELLSYYPSRAAWLFEPDRDKATLKPYPR